MSFWPMLLTIVIVALSAFVVGYRLGTIHGYDRAERMLGEIVAEQAKKRGWMRPGEAILAVDRVIYPRNEQEADKQA